MNFNLKHITQFFLSIIGGLISAIVIFLIIVEITISPVQPEFQVISEDVVVAQGDATKTNAVSLTEHDKTFTCLDHHNSYPDKNKCLKQSTNKLDVSQDTSEVEPNTSLNIEQSENCSLPYFCLLSDKLFIQLIYLLQFIALWIEVSIVLYVLLGLITKIKNNNLGNFFGSASRWAIDSPPVIGVVGTLYAFSYAANAASSTNIVARQLTEVFKTAFNDAVLTTMFGGIIYVINLALNIIKDSNVKV
jgi:hypothetical protein